MRLIRNFERSMERWTQTAWSAVRPPRSKPMEVVAVLRRECDDNALIMKRGRTLVPNHFTIELPRAAHGQLRGHGGDVATQLATQVRRHAAERRYHFTGPVTVQLTPHAGTDSDRYRVRSHIVPYRAPAAPDDSTKALPVLKLRD